MATVIKHTLNIVAWAAIACTSALAQTPPDGSIWRPNLADQRAKLNLIDRTGVHGTYQSEMYLLFLKDPKTGALAVYSDIAKVRYIARPTAKAGAFTITTPDGKKTLANLTFDPLCASRARPNDCFRIAGATADSGLVNGPFVPMKEKPDPGGVEKLDDVFVNFPGNFNLALLCYDIVTLNDSKFTSDCGLNLFKTPPGNSTKYKAWSTGTQKMGIPFGWTYIPIEGSSGRRSDRILENGSDVTDTFESSVGFNVGINLLIFNFSTHYNQITKSRIENMRNKSLTYGRSEYLYRQFALVVDKSNLRLDDSFQDELDKLARDPQPDYDAFIGNWGTHYPYATTFGARGRLFNAMTREEVVSLHDQGFQWSVGASAGLQVDDVGASIGGDGGTATDHLNRLKRVLGSGFSDFECVGGGGCAGDGTPKDDSRVFPILFDLRPLSDLVAPPFYKSAEDLDKITRVRDGLAAAILKRMYYKDDGQGKSAVRFARVLGAPEAGGRPAFSCNQRSITRPGAPPAPDSPFYACCQQGSPIVTQLTMGGLTNPVVAAPGSPFLTLGSNGPVVVVPDGTRPLVSQVQVGYVFAQMRTTGGQLTFSYPFNFDRYCQTRGGGSPINVDGTGYGWRCGNEQMDIAGGCREQRGDGFSAILRGAPPGKPYDWFCDGPKVPGFTAQGTDGVPLLTAPQGQPFKSLGDAPVDVITALSWSGDAAQACGGVNPDLKLRLQAVSAKELLDPPRAEVGGQRKRVLKR